LSSAIPAQFELVGEPTDREILRSGLGVNRLIKEMARRTPRSRQVRSAADSMGLPLTARCALIVSRRSAVIVVRKGVHLTIDVFGRILGASE
jgi:hypothetical protein